MRVELTVDERPSMDAILMETAELMARRGTCTRAAVGCVVAIQDRPIVSGYNGAAAGLPHCRHEIGDDAGCQRAVHAEANAVAFAARLGVSTQGATLYTTLSPCLTCSRLLINSGIIRVVYNQSYRDLAGLDELQAAGVICEKWWNGK